MADRQISVSRLIRKLEERRSDKAMKLVEGGGSYEEFLRGTGQYREIRSLIQYLENLIDKDDREPAPKDEEPDQPDDLDPNEEEENEEESERPAPAPRVRRTKPRGWGGG